MPGIDDRQIVALCLSIELRRGSICTGTTHRLDPFSGTPRPVCIGLCQSGRSPGSRVYADRPDLPSSFGTSGTKLGDRLADYSCGGSFGFGSRAQRPISTLVRKSHRIPFSSRHARLDIPGTALLTLKDYRKSQWHTKRKTIHGSGRHGRSTHRKTPDTAS